MHALAGIDHRTLGIDEQGCGFLDMHGIGAIAGAQHRRIVQRLRHFLVPHVGRDFHDHRSAAAVLQLGEGAAEDVADFGGDVDRLGRLGKCPHRLAGIEVRFDIRQPARIAHRQHQHRHGFAVTLRDAAHGIFRARAVLHAEGADGVPGSDPRDRVRHVKADAFLPHHHRADVGIGGVFDEVIDRVAAKDLDAFALHDFRNGGAEFHADLSPIWPMLSSAWTDSWNRNPSPGKARGAPLLAGFWYLVLHPNVGTTPERHRRVLRNPQFNRAKVTSRPS